jgi:Na+/H+-dicarboxylate symporter
MRSAPLLAGMRRLYSIPFGLLLGIVLALLFPAGAPYVGWLGQIFLAVLKLLILPLILVSVFGTTLGGHSTESPSFSAGHVVVGLDRDPSAC